MANQPREISPEIRQFFDEHVEFVVAELPQQVKDFMEKVPLDAEIMLDGKAVGTATTNGAGFVEFQLRTAAFIDDPGDGEPMASSFPSLKGGDEVTVGNLSAVLN